MVTYENPVAGRLVYLSGPMRGVPDFNRPAFAEAEELCRRLGSGFVFNPCEQWREGGKLPDWPRREFMRRDFRFLTSGEVGVVVALDGFLESVGSKHELEVAVDCGIPVTTMAVLRVEELLRGGRGVQEKV